MINIIQSAAQKYFSGDDPSHDFRHVLRVLHNAEILHKAEGGDWDIIAAAVFFHDCVNYPKNDTRAANAASESADTAERELQAIADYPQHKIPAVKQCIIEHSFSAGLQATSLESQIMQDADRLEATGAIAIMRTYASTGQMKREFYHPDDPFCEHRAPEAKKYALDLFFERLFIVGDRMNTAAARAMAHSRTQFLDNFLNQVAEEIGIPRPEKFRQLLQKP